MSTKSLKRPLAYLDFDLADREGEQWRSVPNYDGIYEVSNQGRIKSLARWSVNRMTKERILSQLGSVAALITLCQDGHQKSAYVMHIVADAFNLRKPEDHVWYHIDKNQFNNNLTNIAHGTVSTSIARAYAVGVIQAIRPNGLSQGDWKREEARKHEQLFGQFEGGQLVRKVCVACLQEHDIAEFRRGSTTNSTNRICRTCKLVRAGVNDIGKLKNRVELAQAGLRSCSVCKVTKRLDDDFAASKNAYMGRSNNCRACANKLVKKYNALRKAKLLSARTLAA